MENRNKILAALFTFIIMAALVGGYFYYFGKSDSQVQTTYQPKLAKVSDDKVISPVVAYNGTAVWYFDSGGHLYRRALVGDLVTEYVLPSLVSNFKEAVWPQKGDDFMLVTTGGLKHYYNDQTKKFHPLPANVQSFDWMPDGRRIAYIWKSGDNKSQQLMIANADASGFQKVVDVFWPDLVVKVSPDGKSALLLRSTLQDVNKIYRADLETGQFETVVEEGKNTEVEWVSTTKFVYVQIGSQGDVTNTQRNIKIYDLVSKMTSDLGLSVDLNKIATDAEGKYLYAASQGSIWKIDLQTFHKQELYTYDQTINPNKLFMHGQMLLFTNTLDGKLYTLTQ